MWQRDLFIRPFLAGSRIPFTVGLGDDRQLRSKYPLDLAGNRGTGADVAERYYVTYDTTAMCVAPIVLNAGSMMAYSAIVLHSDLKPKYAQKLAAEHQAAAMFIAHYLSGFVGEALLLNKGNLKPLSPRESEILRLIAAGCRPVEIADRLAISTHTVEFHLKSVRTKLETPTLPHAVTRALASNQISF